MQLSKGIIMTLHRRMSETQAALGTTEGRRSGHTDPGADAPREGVWVTPTLGSPAGRAREGAVSTAPHADTDGRARLHCSLRPGGNQIRN